MVSNLYIRHISAQVLEFQYADNSTLIKVIPSKDDRIVTADEMNADLGRIYSMRKEVSGMLSY